MKKMMFLFALAVLGGCGKSSPSLSPLDVAAHQICKDRIETRATNRKSIVYLSDPAPAVTNAKGQLEVSVKFSAKNEIGMASTMLVKCAVSPDGKKLLNFDVNVSR